MERPSLEIFYVDAMYFGDGGSRVAAGEDGGWRGIITHQDGFFFGAATLETMLGRTLDYGRYEAGRTLSELIDVATAVEYMAPTDEEPWPGLRAVGAIGHGWTSVEARVDPDRQFMPRVMRAVRVSDGAIAETVVVLGVQEVEGVHLPHWGLRCPRSSEVMEDDTPLVPAHVREDFEQALRLKGLPELPAEEASNLRRWIDLSHEVRWLDRERRIAEGPLAWLSAERRQITPNFVIIDAVEINTPMTTEAMMAEFPPGTTVLSGYTWRRGSLRDEVRIWEAWGPRVVGREEEAAP
jgi:hypothetical protein